MDLLVLRQAEREMSDTPEDIKQDLFSLFDSLLNGVKLSLPISRPLFSIVGGLHELRLSGRSGEYRVFYLIRPDAIYILHSMKKKTQKMSIQTINLLKARAKGCI